MVSLASVLPSSLLAHGSRRAHPRAIAATALVLGLLFSGSSRGDTAPQAEDEPKGGAPPATSASAEPAPEPAAPATPAPSPPPSSILAPPAATPEPEAAPPPAPEPRAVEVARDLPEPAPAEPEAPPPPPLNTLPYFPFNLTFIYPLAVNVGRPNILTNLDIALLVSRVGAVEGLQTGVLTYTEVEVRGVQASVAAISGRTTGLQIAGAFAFADGDLRGAQVSGVFGWAGAPVVGAQIAGVASQSRKNVEGIQLSGAVNIARGRVRGVQAAGLLNIGRVDGVQIGLINVSAEVNGLQIGLFNVARKVDGFQLGLVNITEGLSGESLGLANILKPGAIHLSLWGSNSINGNVGVKFASKYAYSILSAAATPEEKKAVFGAGLTLGLRFARPFSIESTEISGDLGGYRLFPDGASITGHDEIYKARVYASFEIASRLTVFAGGGAYVGLRGKDALDVRVGPEGFGGVDF